MFQPGARPDSSDALDGIENESDSDRDRKEESSQLSDDEDALSHSSGFSNDVSSDVSHQRIEVASKWIDPDYAKFYTKLFEMAQEHKEEENCSQLMERGCQGKGRENKQDPGSTDDSTEEEIVRLIEETRNGSNRMDGEGWIINSAC